jgi:ADP-dependent NAD(P)H-hydrate dehydratase / NAD(P)H-hydrate epimerase
VKVVTAAQMQELDHAASRQYGIPVLDLMERAGEGVALCVRNLADRLSLGFCSVLVVAGKGNNGGDALVAARHLAQWGFAVNTVLAMHARDLKPEALANLKRLKSGGGKVEERLTDADWPACEKVAPPIVVDGVFGTGFKGPARGTGAGAIRHINRLAAGARVVSIDVPSGLDSDTGVAEGDVVRADLTVTLELPKAGLVVPGAVEYVGNLVVVGIGIPEELTSGLPLTDVELVTDSDVRRAFPRRARASHKGDFGHVLIIGGAPGFAGAPTMAAAAAMRCGAGLVSLLVPAGLVPVVAHAVPEAMTHGGHETSAGTLAGDCLAKWGRPLSDFDAILIGPGMSQHVATRQVLERVILGGYKSLVVDADAINAMAGQTDTLRRCTVPTVLTPHPGEMARLMRIPVQDVQRDRWGVARRLAEASRAVVVLKGAGTVVAERDAPLRVNLTGNPGMARGGMGDVLGGMIAGIAAKGTPLSAAAAAAVYLHGLAGDMAAGRMTEAALTAMDVVRELPYALRSLNVV